MRNANQPKKSLVAVVAAALAFPAVAATTLDYYPPPTRAESTDAQVVAEFASDFSALAESFVTAGLGLELHHRRAMVLHETLADDAIANSPPRSFDGRPIWLVSDADRTSRGAFLVQSGLHGDEQIGPQLALWMAGRYSAGHGYLAALSRVSGRRVDFLPFANPDGFVAGTRRNARGVDLNRSFPAPWFRLGDIGGPERRLDAAANPETAALGAIIKSGGYSAAVDIHGYIDWIVVPSAAMESAGLGSVREFTHSDVGRWSRVVGALAASRIAPRSIHSALSLDHRGAYEDWAFAYGNTPTFCLELGEEVKAVRGARSNVGYLGEAWTADPRVALADVEAAIGRNEAVFVRYERMIAESFMTADRLFGHNHGSGSISH